MAPPEDDYSAWNSNQYSGCFKCHAATALGQTALTNSQLANAQHNMQEWAAVGYPPIMAPALVLGAAEIGTELSWGAASSCLSNPICRAILVGGGAGAGRAGPKLTSPPLTLPQAQRWQEAFVGENPDMFVTNGGNVQMMGQPIVNEAGQTIRYVARLDVNLADYHVTRNFPHLNLEIHVDGAVIPMLPAHIRVLLGP